MKLTSSQFVFVAMRRTIRNLSTKVFFEVEIRMFDYKKGNINCNKIDGEIYEHFSDPRE